MKEVIFFTFNTLAVKELGLTSTFSERSVPSIHDIDYTTYADFSKKWKLTGQAFRYALADALNITA